MPRKSLARAEQSVIACTSHGDEAQRCRSISKCPGVRHPSTESAALCNSTEIRSITSCSRAQELTQLFSLSQASRRLIQTHVQSSPFITTAHRSIVWYRRPKVQTSRSSPTHVSCSSQYRVYLSSVQHPSAMLFPGEFGADSTALPARVESAWHGLL